jgi:hypothetical protein
MKKLLLMAMAVSLISCQPEELDTVNDAPTSTPPVPCTLKLSRDYNPLAGMQSTTFRYYHVDGTERLLNNPMPTEIDSVDFSMPVRITAYAGNNMNPQVLCNWNLKKDGVIIEVQNVSYFVYEN